MATSLVQIQRKLGVDPDGKLGPATLDAIAKAIGLTASVTSLHDPAKFFASVRARLFASGLDQSQVDGINTTLAACGAAGWGIPFTAYALATKYKETNRSMQPVEEAYFLGPKAADAYRRKLRYWPWTGRGDVQITWEKNYRLADDKLGLGGALTADPNLALRPDIAAKIMVRGMEEGWFTGRKLADTLPDCGAATREKFKASRPIINGHDCDDEIAGYALAWQDGLTAGAWA